MIKDDGKLQYFIQIPCFYVLLFIRRDIGSCLLSASIWKFINNKHFACLVSQVLRFKYIEKENTCLPA
jgi:hypothetical protein